MRREQCNPVRRFCSNCGKQIVGPVSLAATAPGPSAGTRSPARSVLAGVFGFQHRRSDRSLHRGEYDFCARAANSELLRLPGAFLRPLLSVIAILLLAKAALGFIAGWGLLQDEGWARILALVLGFVSLFTNIPFGTALGIYTMWVLLPPIRSENTRPRPRQRPRSSL